MIRARTRRSSGPSSLRGIRPRVVAAFVVLLLAALLTANVVVRQVLLGRLDDEIEQALVQEVEELRNLADGRNPATGEPFDDDVESMLETFLSRNVPAVGEAFYTLVDGRPHLTSYRPPAALTEDAELVARWAALDEPTREDLDTTAGEARTLAVPVLDGSDVLGTFVVAYFPADDRAEIGQAVRTVAAVSAVVAVLASVLAWSLAGRVLRPVARLTGTAQRVTESDLTARIPVEGDDELARLGTTFNAMLDRLERGFRSQRDFLNDVAHDLRTPITIVRGHLEVLGDDPAEREETVALVLDELDHMNRYVTDLLVLAKAEQPDFLRTGPVDVGEWITEVHDRVHALGDRRWVLDAEPAVGEVVTVADAGRLTQAVLNLAANAAEHTCPGDEIGLGAEATGRTVRVWVRDTGSGIAPELQAGLFARAARGEASRTARREGTGLGLAIVRAVAEAHGGTVTVTSEPGAGATFDLVLPRHDGADPTEELAP